jgi:hypothetical protein
MLINLTNVNADRKDAVDLESTSARPRSWAGVALPRMEIRDAGEADLPEILAIYNDVIATSTAVYHDDPVTLDDRRRMARRARGAGVPGPGCR